MILRQKMYFKYLEKFVVNSGFEQSFDFDRFVNIIKYPVKSDVDT